MRVAPTAKMPAMHDRTLRMLADRAAAMREALGRSQGNTRSVVGILGSFDHRLSALDSAMRPTQVRMHSIRRAHENIDKTIKAAEVILQQFDLSRQAEAKILKGPHEDLESYLEAVDQLRSNLRFFSSNKSFKSSDGAVNHANGLLAKAILKLEEEFKQLLTSYSKPIEPDRLYECLPNNSPHSSESLENDSGQKNARNPENNVYTPPTLIPPRIVPLLHDLAVQMVEAGHVQELAKIYRDSRSSVLEQSLRKLGVERLSKDEVQKLTWENLEEKIGNWIHYMRIAVKLLFAAEKKLCDQIFGGIEFKDICFAEVTANSVTMLLSFGETIAISKRSPEKLFVLLDMFEVMHDLHSEMAYIFGGKPCLDVRDAAATLTKRLAQTGHEILGDFEEAVEKDATRTVVADGAVHPLTSYVMNYVKFLFDYQSTLKQLFQEFESGGKNSNSQLADLTLRIVQGLQSNLDVKSKQYKDPALTHLFLMNNIHYIVRSVRKSEANDLLGDDWVQRYRRVVQQHANHYKRVAWSKILQCISTQGLTSSGGSGPGSEGGNSSGVSRSMVKDRFKSFNMQFEELYFRQCQWTVPDIELREHLRLSIAEILLPAYRAFIKRFGPLIEGGKSPQKYIRLKPEEAEGKLADLFEEKLVNDPRR